MRSELAKPDYLAGNPIDRLLDWINRVLSEGMDTASNFSPLSALSAMIIAVLLIGGLAWLTSQARFSAQVSPPKHAVLTEEAATADQLRSRAEAALAGGRHEEALVEGFRALALRQVERGRLEDAPGTTAQEAARALAGEYPEQRFRVHGSALLFDSVLYGDRAATRSQAVDVLGLDDELGGTK